MIISHQWLSEWVAVPSDINRLSDLLTMAGLEVGGVESVTAVSKRVVVGEVIDSIPQKDRPQLKICRVDTGHARVRNIVCGAAYVQAGIKVAVALPGAKLASGPVRAQRFGDVLSNGMLCSSAELGVDDDSDGVLVLDNDAETGRGLNDHLELGDVLLDIELTPNRGDCLSVVGVAREVAAITGAGLMPPVLRNIRSIHDHRISIKLEAPKDCPRWIGRVITGLRPATRTPDRIRERLRRSGIRSIDCVVDITNYVMIEYGQPMHAFRLDRIDSEIRVRHARRNERLTLLDGKKITMDPTTLVIADKNKSVALAGIMGGLKTAITADTRNVLLEAAYFRPQAVAQRARQMALQTDAVYRFERGVDPALQRTAMIRATALLCEATGAAPGPLCQAVVPGYLPQRRWIRLRRSRLDLMLGTRLPTAQISQVLNRLAMEVKRNGHDWLVRAPSYRLDISYEHDLIEEVARITNYENLPTHLPTARAPRGVSKESSLSVSVIQDFLVARDFQEVITYSFVDSRREVLISPSARALRLKNPIADNMDVMRTSLWPGLLETVLANMRRQERRIRIFEIGRVFQSNRKGVSERRCIGGCITGPVSGDQWDRERN